MAEPLLEMKNITKIFAGIKANDNVNLTLYPGERKPITVAPIIIRI